VEQEQSHDHHILMLALVDELARCGIAHACTSPGSRSTPIVLPLVRDGRIRRGRTSTSARRGSSRSGLARATGRAVAIACTSGTAAANLAPAVPRGAARAACPLIVLTADRRRSCARSAPGQVIDQVKLYGSAAKWFFEVGVDDASPDRVRWMRSLACRAVWTAEEGRPGVVHLNLPFRDPLVAPRRAAATLERVAPGRPGGAPWLRRLAPEPPSPPPAFDLPPRSVVVAGHRAGRAAAAFAAAARSRCSPTR
jgi:2-succinyl-5-enolpyruvyl-6-hydroxy-3-cyclohexene-1-carboxylate synthase